MTQNRRIVLAERPRYITPTANCFQLQSGALPQPGEGQLLVRTTWLSLDPYLHGRLKRTTAQAEPVKVGDVMVGATIGRIEQSRHPDYKAGDLVRGFWGWQDYAAVEPKRVHKLDPCLQQPSLALGTLGLPGFGAWLALRVLSPVKAGETVVIGTATGALGQTAGQIAKLMGCRVVGIAGGPEKCRLATERLGYDACVDHRQRDFADHLRAACPKGIDVYVETIGGKATSAVLRLCNLQARVTVAGLMSMITRQGSAEDALLADDFLNEVVNRRLSIRGLVTFDHIETHFGLFQDEMLAWIGDGRVKPVEHVVDGLEHAPSALQGLFEGRNLGKLIVKVAD
ncbi:NADP-dependent oxidoreductase [Solimonas sp. K1W22B-7]|uniref:NADP-dependent oxidoreductase n=1 Tax=Solimonas sp. K1W22B-7 TaxID=2303331 RepID=UPI000E333E9C|nr:NADP-dependent oxidoreductase [Solimonas sp. K1W22B-7]AXQ31083.1 NADP-dependent oxidoreductase [Solimonas sp. K1W22B-7]